MRRNHKAGPAASSARAARRIAAQVTPLARKTGAAAGRGVHQARTWAAPQVERTGQVLQHSVAPKVSAWLSSAAQRLEPAKPRRGWRKLGIPVITAAAGAAAALARNRRKQDVPAQADPDTAAAADAGGATPAAQPGNGQAKASADSKGPVRTS
jgi:hypothetical protein